FASLQIPNDDGGLEADVSHLARSEVLAALRQRDARNRMVVAVLLQKMLRVVDQVANHHGRAQRVDDVLVVRVENETFRNGACCWWNMANPRKTARKKDSRRRATRYY